ncbi:MAG: outer membrane protein assembly factor BamA [Nitrospirae bacterium]|nr:outer membrane protein assembly factor BamA [Nitrospirota bacterium]
MATGSAAGRAARVAAKVEPGHLPAEPSAEPSAVFAGFAGWLLALWFLTVVLLPIQSYALVAVPVSSITVKGLYNVPEREFLFMLGLKKGGTLDPISIGEGIKAAFLKGTFNDIRVYADGGNVTVEVVERPFVNSVDTHGTSHFSGKKLRADFELKAGDQFSEGILGKAIEAMKKSLARKGFPKAVVTARAIYTKIPYRVNVELKVDEGTPLVIKSVAINGLQGSRFRPANSADGSSRSDENGPLQKNNAESGFIQLIKISPGDVFDRDKVEAKIADAANELKKEGYFNPRVGPFTYDEGTGALNVKVATGKKLQVLFVGNEKFSQKALAKEMPFFEYRNIDSGTIEEALLQIVAMYHQKGYAYVSVTYEKTETDVEAKIIFTITEGPSYKVSGISLKGVSIKEKPILDILSLQKGAPFDPDTIEDAKDAIVEYYSTIGFSNARVMSFANETRDLEKTAALTIVINEGDRLTIGSIEVSGTDEKEVDSRFRENDILDKEVRPILNLKSGTALNEYELFEARQRAISYYSGMGYNDIKVAIEKKPHDTAVDLVFAIDKGERYVFGDTIVAGNRKTKWEVFRRIFAHKRGDPFNASTVYEEVRDLYKTELFSNVNVSFVDRPGHVKDVLFSVNEADAKIVDFGLGYGEYEGPRGSLGIRYLNLMGMDRQVSLQAKMSGLNQRYSLQYYEPWFITKNLPLRATIGYEDRKEIDIDTRDIRYRVEKYSASIGVERYLTDKLKGQVYYEFSLANTWDVRPDITLSRDDVGTLVVSAIVPSLIYDTRNSLTNPSSGILAGASLKFATALLMSQTDFTKLSGYMNYYRGLSDDFILAASVRTGIAQGWNQTTDLPITERFFLGGSTTVRGYGQDNLGPKGYNGDPTGGNAYLMGNLELRVNVIDNFGVVPFFDAGNLWNDINKYNPADVKYTTGLGLRYMTPVGPLRVDYGHLLSHEKDERAGRFYFSIGQAF